MFIGFGNQSHNLPRLRPKTEHQAELSPGFGTQIFHAEAHAFTFTSYFITLVPSAACFTQASASYPGFGKLHSGSAGFGCTGIGPPGATIHLVEDG